MTTSGMLVIAKMKRFRQISAFLFLFLWAFVPMVVCVQPATAQITEAEHICCHQMKMSCGQMQMPASHACCNKDLQSSQTAAVYKDIAIIPPPAMAVSELLGLDSLMLAQSSMLSHPFDTSPPLFSAAASSILRI